MDPVYPLLRFALTSTEQRTLPGFGIPLHGLGFIKDLPLVELHKMNCGIADLAPLVGLKLKVQEAGSNPAATLALLAGSLMRVDVASWD